jgi:hypothetical protein
MADPTEMRVKEQRRADALRANLKRRKATLRDRDARESDTSPAKADAVDDPPQQASTSDTRSNTVV